MTASIQSVINSIPKVTHKIISSQKIAQKFSLNISLILRTSERKNFSSLARHNNLSYRSVYITELEANDCIESAKKYLIELICSVATKGKKGRLLIDFTDIAKPFSKHIPDVTYDYSGSTKRIEKGLSLGIAVWSNGIISIPFNFEKWLRKKDAGNTYKTKIELAQELILAARQVIPFDEVMLDGAFASKKMIQFLDELNQKFTMRIPRNRVVNVGNKSFQLRHCPKFKFNKNRKFKTICAYYKGFRCYFTAHKRKTKNTGVTQFFQSYD